MKTRQRWRYFLFFLSVFMLILYSSGVNFISSAAQNEDIDIERLIKAANNNRQKIDAIQRPQAGGNQMPPQQAGGNLQIPANAIITDIPQGTQPLIGTAVKVRVKPGFTFGDGNLRQAVLKWVTSDGRASQPMPLSVQGGVVTNFAPAFYEFRPATAGQHGIRFEIEYKLFGDANARTASSPQTSVIFAGGAPGQAGQPGQPAPPATADNFVPPPPGQDTPPNTISKKIPINFNRPQVNGAGIEERRNYTWSWPHAQLQQPTSNPARAYAYVIQAVRRGEEIDIDDSTMISGADYGSLSQEQQGSYVEYNGAYYKRFNLDVDGDGPLPDSLEAHWEVKYPSVTPNGANGWNIEYNLSKGSGRGDNFTFSMPEPSEPFNVAVKMKVKHVWRDFGYDKSPSELLRAIAFYRALQNNADPLGVIVPGNRYKDIRTTPGNISASGGVCTAGPSGVSVTVSGTITYMEYEKVGERTVTDSNGQQRREDVMEWRGPKTQGRSQSFRAGTVKHSDEPNKFTDEAVVHELVLDTTAPRIEFAPQAIGGMTAATANGDIICTTGDLINVRVKITDNNKYSALRTPYLTYETAPSGNNPAGAPWSAVPLMMEPCAGVPDNNAPRPFASGNWGYFQALVPAPHNIKGAKALRWFVDAFDGASYRQPQPFNGADCYGNFNHGNFQYNGEGPNTRKVEPNFATTGTLSIYDNDRPNISVKMWKVDRAGIYLVGEFEAGEDYFIEDFYYDMTNPSNIIDSSGPAGEYKGRIPPDTAPGNVPAAAALLGPNSAGSQIPGALVFPTSTLFPAAKKQPVADNLIYQIEDAGYNFFKFQAGYSAGAVGGLRNGNCPVLFEDVKYIFTVDAYDNVEAIANNGIVTNIPRPERTKLSFELKDADNPVLSAVNMEFRANQSAAVTSANEGKLWYLGPEDPSIPLAAGAPLPKEVPTFEHVFHSVSQDNSVGNRYLKLAATDRCGHKRHMAIHFKISEVTNELRVLEEKIKRELNARR